MLLLLSSEQIMSADKYPSIIFSRQIEAAVYVHGNVSLKI